MIPDRLSGVRSGPFCPQGYVRQSEDRLCEPRSPRLDHRRKHPVRGPPWAGGTAGFSMIFHGGGLPGRLRNSRGLKPHPGRTDFPEFLPIWDRTFPYHGNVAGGQLRQTGSGYETVQLVLCQTPAADPPTLVFHEPAWLSGLLAANGRALQRCGAPLVPRFGCCPPFRGLCRRRRSGGSWLPVRVAPSRLPDGE